MGELAIHNGQTVKIGTCEDMLYLRADQARQVRPHPTSVDAVRDAEYLRFRFPWPDEDGVAPRRFEDPYRRMVLWGASPPTEHAEEHYRVQFTSPHGYVTSLPCPESGKCPEGVQVARNGFKGAVFLVQQRLHEGLLVPVLQCACGLSWRVPTLEDAAPLFEALLRADERYRGSFVEPLPVDDASGYDVIIDRVRRGFDPAHVAGLFGTALAGAASAGPTGAPA